MKQPDTIAEGVRLLHELGDTGHHGCAIVAGPLPHLAEVKTLASITGSDEGGVEAHGHVRPPHGKTHLASSGVGSLGANLGDEDSGLLRNRLGGGQPLQESGGSSVALITGGSKASGGEGNGGGNEQNLHFDWSDFL